MQKIRGWWRLAWLFLPRGQRNRFSITGWVAWFTLESSWKDSGWGSSCPLSNLSPFASFIVGICSQLPYILFGPLTADSLAWLFDPPERIPSTHCSLFPNFEDQSNLSSPLRLPSSTWLTVRSLTQKHSPPFQRSSPTPRAWISSLLLVFSWVLSFLQNESPFK